MPVRVDRAHGARTSARSRAANSAVGSGKSRANARPPHEQLGLSAEQLRKMFEVMLLARAVDERQWILQRQGKQAFHISCQGHEGSGVGSAFALEAGKDLMIPYYRGLAAEMAFGMTARDAFLGALARAEDRASGGRMMPAHFSCSALGIITNGSCVATQIPHAAGAALASKLKGDGAVVITYFGDGASSKADFHEGLNFAGIHKLPAIFVCENNRFAISVPQQKQMAVQSVADRGPAYGMPGIAVDGTDILAVYAAVKEAAARARRGDGPTLIEAEVVRMTPHSSDDDDRRYRSESDRQAAKSHDPLVNFRRYLQSHGLLDEATEEAMQQRVKAEVDEGLAYAEQAGAPDPATAFDQVLKDIRLPASRATNVTTH